MKFVLLLCIFLFSASVVSARDKGILNLDSLTFDKIVGGPFPVFVRFDKEYPYGDEHDAFKNAAQNISASSAITASVGISEWGEKENQDLADRFKIKKEQWPVYMFFPKESQEGVTFQGDKKNKDALLRFVRNQGVYVGLTGCIEKFDQLAKDFIADKAKRADVLAKAEALQSSDKKNEASAKHYISIMKKLIEVGEGFLGTEAERLAKLLKDKSVKPDKKKNFEARSNILHTFTEAAAAAKSS